MCAIAAPVAAHAQAYVAERGSVSGSLTYNYGFASAIAMSDGFEYKDQFVRTQAMVLGAEYVPLENLAVGLTLPFIAVIYDAEQSGALYDPHGPYDDGSYHFNLQDLRADARYMVLESPVTLAVNLGLTMPLTDYAVQGSAALGRHLVQGRLGVFASYSPTFLGRAFISGGYELTLSQKFDKSPDTAKFGQTRSDVNAQLGYFATDTLAIFLTSLARIQHDGVDFVKFDSLTADQQIFHDGILKEAVLLAGLGASYQLTDALSLNAGYAQFIGGRNTLKSNAASLSVGWAIR